MNPFVEYVRAALEMVSLRDSAMKACFGICDAVCPILPESETDRLENYVTGTWNSWISNRWDESTGCRIYSRDMDSDIDHGTECYPASVL